MSRPQDDIRNGFGGGFNRKEREGIAKDAKRLQGRKGPQDDMGNGFGGGFNRKGRKGIAKAARGAKGLRMTWGMGSGGGFNRKGRKGIAKAAKRLQGRKGAAIGCWWQVRFWRREVQDAQSACRRRSF